ncbi:MAG TPA: DNA-formamidopyrimidine glycosylase family protein [Euzebyales bacterium]|nr:DNA-formamidopyrimidine glycosylase family protein [Euzebyales bacterium]
MPEGDTIFRAARALRHALEGETVTAVATTVGQVRALGEQRLVGQTVGAVEPRGKHLVIWFSPSELALHSHMRMAGSWHLYRHGQRWRKPRHLLRFRLETAQWLALCFSAPVIELLSADQVARHPTLAALGPDALGEQPDLAEVRWRLDAGGDMTIGEALLDQRVLAGVGNVYKNEVLFIHRVDPWTPVAEVDPETRDALLDTAVQLLRRNVRPGQARRVTTAATGAGRDLHVYGRSRRPCPRCQRPIAVARQGDQGRLTYWCQSCQGPGRP